MTADGWKLPDGWRGVPQPIADCWVIYPPEGYGEPFPVSLWDTKTQAEFREKVRAGVEARMREIEGPAQ